MPTETTLDLQRRIRRLREVAEHPKTLPSEAANARLLVRTLAEKLGTKKFGGQAPQGEWRPSTPPLGQRSGSGSHTNEVVDISVVILHETIKAWLLFDGTKEFWCPKSQCENNGDGTFTLSYWIAHEKGLI